MLLDITEYQACCAWTDHERNCLKVVAEHLSSVREIVKVLGPDSLEFYCRNGSLPEPKIEELENLDGVAPDEEDDEAAEETDDDNEE